MDKYRLIERYLMNDMSVKEQVEFEELLKNDPDLMREFLLRKKINHAIQEEDIINLRDNLGNILNEVSESNRTKRIYIYSAVAATVILLITIGNIFLSPFNSKNSNEIFHQYYGVYPAVVSYRSGYNQDEAEKILKDALSYYEAQEYNLASASFRIVLSKDSANYLSQFYLSICEIENGNYAEAEVYLIDLIHKKKHIFWEQSHWYLALLYLKQDKKDNAITILNKIIDEEMTQKRDAETILKLID